MKVTFCSIFNSISYSILLFCVFLFSLTPVSSLAAPGATADERFRPWNGSYDVNNTPINAQVFLGASFSPSSGFTMLNSANNQVLIGPKKLNHRPIFAGTYGGTLGNFRSLLGERGKVLFSVVKGSPYENVTVEFKPEAGASFKLGAVRRSSPYLEANFANKLRVSGKRKIGTKLRAKVSAFARGKSIATPGDTKITFVIGAAVGDVSISKKRNTYSSSPGRSDCETFFKSSFTQIDCTVGYLGPKGLKLSAKKSAGFTVSFTVPDDLAGEELLLATQIGRADRTKNVHKSRTKAKRVKIKEEKGSTGSTSGLNGRFQVGNGVIYVFRKEGSVVNGYIDGNLSNSAKNSGFFVGEQVYRNLKVQGDNLTGQGKSRNSSTGAASWSAVTFTKFGNDFKIINLILTRL